MQTIKDSAKVAALTSVVVVAAFACLLMLQLSTAVKRADAVTSQAVATLGQVQTTLEVTQKSVAESGAKIDKVATKVEGLLDAATRDTRLVGNTLVVVNHGCVPGPCGTLADVAKTLNTVRGTVGQVEIGANHWDRNLTTLDAQELTLFGSLNDAVQGARPVEDAATKMALDVDALALNPAVPKLLANTAEITATSADMLKTADAVETKAMASYLHPSKNPWVRTYRAVEPWLLPMAQVGGSFAR